MKRLGAPALLGAILAAAVAAVGCRNFGEPPPPSLTASPPSLSFSGAADGQSPPTQALTVDQLGTGRLTWTARTDAPWLSVSPASDTAPAVAWVAVTAAGLAAGTYTGTITLASPGAANRQDSVPVTLTLGANLSLAGRWVGTSDSVNLALTLEQSGASVAGSGTFYPPLRALTVTGTYRSPAVALTLTAQDSTVTTFTGSLVGDNAILGTLNGPGLSGVQIAVFRQ
jgi:Viral BACON domain